MDRLTLLQRVKEVSGHDSETVEEVFQSLLSVMSSTMGEGENIECQPDWGKFIPKLRDNVGRNEGSPRTPKKKYYYIQFKPSSSFEAAMFTSAGQRAGGSVEKSK